MCAEISQRLRNLEQQLVRVWVREKVFRMDLEPGWRDSAGRHFGQMWQPQTDARAIARCPVTGRVTTALLIFTPSASCLR